MSVAKVIEITSTSERSFEDAIVKGIARADKTLNNIEGMDQGAESRGEQRQDQYLPRQYAGDLHPQRRRVGLTSVPGD